MDLAKRISNISPDQAVGMAMKALESVASIVPTTMQDLSDDEDDIPVNVPLFVQKLKALVDDSEVSSTRWTENGNSFVIHEPNLLSQQLVKYFKSSKLKSFVRQLHFYGFKKSGGSRYENWVYNHKYFQRHGRLLHKLRRKTCGPDQQIKNLQLQVVNLQDSLADTQQKLGNMAMALAALLQHQHKHQHRSEVQDFGPANTSALPAKRLRATTTIVKTETAQTVKQEPAATRRLPQPLSFGSMNNSLSNTAVAPLTPTILDLTDFGDVDAEMLFSPEFDMFADMDHLSMVGVTA